MSCRRGSICAVCACSTGAGSAFSSVWYALPLIGSLGHDGRLRSARSGMVFWTMSSPMS
jgi:hypothetical protein